MQMNSIHKDIDNYYTEKVKAYGATPQGVDWNGEESQFLRFKKLSKVIKNNKLTIFRIISKFLTISVMIYLKR